MLLSILESTVAPASSKSLTEVVNLLLDKCAQIDLQENEVKSALFIACEKEHIEVVELLLEKHPQVDLQDTSTRICRSLLLALHPSLSCKFI